MKKLMTVAVLAAAALMTGCSHNVGKIDYSAEAVNKTDMTFTGIPTIFGAGVLGSITPVDHEHSITAAHVDMMRVGTTIAKHNHQDIVLIAHKNDEVVEFRDAKIGEAVHLYGFSCVSAVPVESKGHVTGKHFLHSKWHKGLVLDMADAGAIQGMSGGRIVADSDGKTVGIIIAVSNKAVIGIDYADFKGWLNKNLQK